MSWASLHRRFHRQVIQPMIASGQMEPYVVPTQRAIQRQQPLRERNGEEVVDVDAHSECIDLTNEEDIIDLTSPRQRNAHRSVNDSVIVVNGRGAGNASSSRNRRRRNRTRIRDIENRMECLHIGEDVHMEDDLPTPNRGNSMEPVRVSDSPEPVRVSDSPEPPVGISPERPLTVDNSLERPSSSARRALDPSVMESSSTCSVNSPGVKGISCPICMDDYKEIRENGVQLMSTVCGHLFCKPCIQAVIRANHQCPTCRKRLSEKQIHPIFF